MRRTQLGEYKQIILKIFQIEEKGAFALHSENHTDSSFNQQMELM